MDNSYLNDIYKTAKTYWQEKLKDMLLPTTLYKDYDLNGYKKENLEFSIDEKISEELFEFSKFNDFKIYIIFVTLLNILIYKYTKQKCLFLSSPSYISSSDKADNNKLLIVRSKIDETQTLKEFLNSVKDELVESYKNQFFNLNKVLSTPIVYENYITICMQTIHCKEYFEQLNPNIKISICTENKRLKLNIDYNKNLFKKNAIENFASCYLFLLKNFKSTLDIKLCDVEVVDEQQKNILVKTFNNTYFEYDDTLTVIDLFLKQVNILPNKIAIIQDDKKITYKELDDFSNYIANKITTNISCKNNTIIGLVANRSIEMVAGMIGILKTGSAYLPIDPLNPAERINYMLENSGAKLILTQKNCSTPSNLDVITINFESKKHDEKIVSAQKKSNKNDLAYIIYTSGTTGVPKGVMINNKNLVNHCLWHIREHEVKSSDNATLYSSIGFDALAGEIWPYLSSGSTLYVVSDEIRLDVEKLNVFYNKKNISVSFLPTPIGEQFLFQKNNSLRLLMVGGEKLKIFKDINYKLVDNYGPTENTIDTTNYEVTEEKRNSTIGKPISNSRIYILDENSKIIPIGAVGELCISGDSVSPGYINDKKLTSEKFVSNPYESDTLMYKTGDLARFTSDGDIEFLGRIDNQIKIRGFRIELSEIENCLLSMDEISQAVVLIKNVNQSDCLCAYYSSDNEIEDEILKKHLKEKLPYYMVPHFFIYVKNFKCNLSGKIDKIFLMQLDIKRQEKILKNPTNEIESLIHDIFKEVLKISEFGIDDNFFELGGNSLNAAKVMNTVSKKFNKNIPVFKIFECQTVLVLSEYINTMNKINNTVENPVLLKKSEKDKNLFLIHDGTGSVTPYINFCKRINKPLNCWAFSFQLPEIAPINITVEKIATDYINKIKKIQPQGPYYIAARCIGGVIAYEIVNQLEGQGDVVSDIILFDPFKSKEQNFVNFEVDLEKKYVLNEIEKILLEESNHKTVLLDMKRKILENEKLSINDIWRIVSSQLNILTPNQFKEIFELDEIGVHYNETFENESTIALFNKIRTLINATKRYSMPKPINAKLFLIKSSTEDYKNQKDWSLYFNKKVEEHEIVVSHELMFKPRCVSLILELFDTFNF